MAGLAEALIAESLMELGLRDPGFLDRRPVGLPPAADLVAELMVRPPLAGAEADAARNALGAALERLDQGGVRRGKSDSQPLLAAMLAAASADAAAAQLGLLDLAPAPMRDFEQTVAEDYEPRATPGGTAYLAGKGEGRPLVLVNAVGIPLSVWSRLLGDRASGFRVLAAEPSGGGLLEGGMTQPGSLDEDVARIRSMLDAEGVDGALAVGWCSGGRTAVELAAAEPDRIAGLVLTGASLRGAMADEPPPTQFEEDAGSIFAGVARSPGTAGFLSDMLVQSQGVAPETAEDHLLFRLPDRAHARLMTAPFADAASLTAYAQRIAADRGRDTMGALKRLRSPVLSVGGAQDHIVSNDATWAVLQAAGVRAARLEVSGAGHYVHHLQYPYFRLALARFAEGLAPAAAARFVGAG